MKKLLKIIREFWNEIFGWNCPKCKAKRSVFYVDSDRINDTWVELYRCKVCGEEGVK